jgi:hypothetical protein
MAGRTGARGRWRSPRRAAAGAGAPRCAARWRSGTRCSGPPSARPERRTRPPARRTPPCGRPARARAAAAAMRAAAGVLSDAPTHSAPLACAAAPPAVYGSTFVHVLVPSQEYSAHQAGQHMSHCHLAGMGRQPAARRETRAPQPRASPEQHPGPRVCSAGGVRAPHRALHVADDDAVAGRAPDGAEGRHPPACRPVATSAAASAPGNTSPQTRLGQGALHAPACHRRHSLPPTRASPTPAATAAGEQHQARPLLTTHAPPYGPRSEKARTAQLTSWPGRSAAPLEGVRCSTAQDVPNACQQELSVLDLCWLTRLPPSTTGAADRRPRRRRACVVVVADDCQRAQAARAVPDAQRVVARGGHDASRACVRQPRVRPRGMRGTRDLERCETETQRGSHARLGRRGHHPTLIFTTRGTRGPAQHVWTAAPHQVRRVARTRTQLPRRAPRLRPRRADGRALGQARGKAAAGRCAMARGGSPSGAK